MLDPGSPGGPGGPWVPVDPGDPGDPGRPWVPLKPGGPIGPESLLIILMLATYGKKKETKKERVVNDPGVRDW